jgi:hypothetical protein
LLQGAIERVSQAVSQEVDAQYSVENHRLVSTDFGEKEKGMKNYLPFSTAPKALSACFWAAVKPVAPVIFIPA